MSTVATIQVTAVDFVNTHGSLVRLLRAIARSSSIGYEGMTTREVCDVVFNSRSEGLRNIRIAEQAGYIKRVKVERIKSKRKGSNRRVRSRRGRFYILNVLTPLGRDLLVKLKQT